MQKLLDKIAMDMFKMPYNTLHGTHIKLQIAIKALEQTLEERRELEHKVGYAFKEGVQHGMAEAESSVVETDDDDIPDDRPDAW